MNEERPLRRPLRHLSRLDSESIVDRESQLLLAAEVPLCGLDRHVPKQELNLIQLSASEVTQSRTGAAQVVRG